MDAAGARRGKRALDRAPQQGHKRPMEKLEEKLAHLERVTDDLSEIVAQQAREIETLNRRIAMLMQREAEREADQGSHVFTGQEKPPHY